MATEKDNGGAAFPGAYYGEIADATFSVMSLRDYFAAAALTIVASRSVINSDPTRAGEGVAKDAYAIADWMLKERAAK